MWPSIAPALIQRIAPHGHGAALGCSRTVRQAGEPESFGTEWNRFAVWGWSKCLKTWWSYSGSNRRPHRCERCAQPINLNLACTWQPITVQNGPIQTGLAGSCLTTFPPWARIAKLRYTAGTRSRVTSPMAQAHPTSPKLLCRMCRVVELLHKTTP